MERVRAERWPNICCIAQAAKLTRFAILQGSIILSTDRARKLIERIGNDREKLNAAAEELVPPGVTLPEAPFGASGPKAT
jgi:hypothetical protein